MKQKAFTLIELLVVAAIVGVLASAAVLNFSRAQAKSRDARRVSDLAAIQSALEVYYSLNKVYPSGAAGSDRACWINDTNDLGCHPLYALKSAGLLNRVPTDPGTNFYLTIPNPFTSICENAQFYAYQSGGTSYRLGAVQEATNGGCGCDFGWGQYEYCVSKN